MRWTRLGGARSSLASCKRLVLEACKIDSQALELRDLGKTRVVKCDFYGESIVAKGKGGLLLERCFFKHFDSAESIQKDMIASEGVRVQVKKPLKRPTNLAGKDYPR